ncbi:MAG: site-specific integrase [Euryarchaeota archaeon]|nr:site-specific integrase [Euryarchaeota archaeon]MDE1837928.1 site-specific integrase [Euryarchaeota archaeon]MDE1880172.1 site-specific integrase [Euryarchaeota archaeon]MDE2045389.1 site-specific integrase [Thermoplasmata archaeon]
MSDPAPLTTVTPPPKPSSAVALAGPGKVPPPGPPPEVLHRWLERKRRKGCVPSAVRECRQVVVRVLLFLRAEARPLDPAGWTLEDAERIKRFCGNSNWSLQILGNFAQFAGSRVFLEVGNPPPPAPRNVRWRTQDEARAVLEAVRDDPLLSFVGILGLGQGMRRVEWKRLRLEDVDLAQGRLLIRGKGRATPKLAWSPLHPAFPAIYERYLAYRQRLVQESLLRYPGSTVPPEALVLLSNVAQGLRAYSDTTLDELVHAIEERVADRGRPVRLSSHMFRRSGATLLEEALLDSPQASRDGVYRTVQEFLRHENLATTMRYLASNPRRQRRALDQFGQALPWPSTPEPLGEY